MKHKSSPEEISKLIAGSQYNRDNRFFLWGQETNEILYLGFKLKGRYEGPVIWLVEGTHYLTEYYLALLIGRFYIANDCTSIQLITFGEFDRLSATGVIPEDIPEIGGSADFDIPLGKYLPEITQPDQRRVSLLDSVTKSID